MICEMVFDALMVGEMSVIHSISCHNDKIITTRVWRDAES